MTRDRSSHAEAYWAGYERGVQAGHAAGYTEGLAVLNEAATALSRIRPSRTVEITAARERLAHRTSPSLTPAELRTQAAQSWGLPLPTDRQHDTGDDAAATDAVTGDQHGAEDLTDEDDWAWAL